MWIAKPLQALSPLEMTKWKGVSEEGPLAQDLSWGRAIESVGGRTFLVFDPERRVGGLVFSQKSPAEKGSAFECINGPLLEWDRPDTLGGQLATFAMGVSKLTSDFKSLTLKPRWATDTVQSRLLNLPIEPFSFEEAATRVISVEQSEENQFSPFSPRLKRTLRRSLGQKMSVQIEKPSAKALIPFVEGLNRFSHEHSFSVPPLKWFETLIHPPSSDSSITLEFFLTSVQALQEGRILGGSQILVCIKNSIAFYLFGYDLPRDPKLPSSISTAAVAHWSALRTLAELGIATYDLNGYLVDAERTDPYYGVCQFKEQFGGKTVKYVVPTFVIR